MPEETQNTPAPTSESIADSPTVQTDEEVLPTTGEGCPTPLAWKQVRSEFLKQSTEFSFSEDGLTISGRVLGEGTPLYFLDGISASPTLFCLTVWLLRDEFRCVILDYPPEARSLQELAHSLHMTSEQFGDEQFDLYATSFGTAVALHAMRDSPQRINRAVLQGPVTSIQYSMAERLALGTLGWLPGKIQSLPLRKTVLENNHSRWFPPFDITRWQFLMHETGDVPTRDVACRAKMLRSLDFSSELSEIDTPTLVISSEGEAARHRTAAKALSAHLKNSTSEEMSNTGHVPFVTHPHRLVKLIKPFLHPHIHDDNSKPL